MNDEYAGKGGSYIVVDGKRVPASEAKKPKKKEKVQEKADQPIEATSTDEDSSK